MKYYAYGDMYCVVGTKLSYGSYINMCEDFKDTETEMVEVPCPNDISDDMLVW